MLLRRSWRSPSRAGPGRDRPRSRLAETAEELGPAFGEGLHQHRPIEVAVSALAGGLRGEEAGVAGGAVERVVVPAGFVLRAVGIGGAVPHRDQRLLDVPRELVALAQPHESTKGAFAVRGAGRD